MAFKNECVYFPLFTILFLSLGKVDAECCRHTSTVYHQCANIADERHAAALIVGEVLRKKGTKNDQTGGFYSVFPFEVCLSVTCCHKYAEMEQSREILDTVHPTL